MKIRISLFTTLFTTMIFLMLIFAFSGTALAQTCQPNTSWTQTYTVQPGDRLYQIAQSTGTTVDELAAANCISNPNLIYPGQIIRVPNTPVNPNPPPNPGAGNPPLISIVAVAQVNAQVSAYGIARNIPTGQITVRALNSQNQILAETTASVPGAVNGGTDDWQVFLNVPSSANGQFGSINAYSVDANGQITATASTAVTYGQICTLRADWTGVYTVQSGDTLSSIAAAYGVTTAQLAQANCLVNSNLIVTGEELRVPSSSPVTPTAQVIIYTPNFGQSVPNGTTLQVTGDASFIPTGTVIVRLLSASNTTLAEQTVTVPGSQTGSAVPWNTSFAVNYSSPVRTVYAFATDASGVGVAASGNVTVNSNPQNCQVQTNWPVYTVQFGDTLGSIAAATGTSTATLAQANCITNPNTIFVGQQLHVPTLPS